MLRPKQKSNKLPSNRESFVEHPKKEAISDALLQPWFLSLETAKAVIRMIPRAYFSRMRWYFEDYGCLRCRKKNEPYGGNCLCVYCRHLTALRISRSMKHRLKSVKMQKSRSTEPAYINRARLAEKLLGDLVADGL